jgi:hypothetical protein
MSTFIRLFSIISNQLILSLLDLLWVEAYFLQTQPLIIITGSLTSFRDLLMSPSYDANFQVAFKVIRGQLI